MCPAASASQGGTSQETTQPREAKKILLSFTVTVNKVLTGPCKKNIVQSQVIYSFSETHSWRALFNQRKFKQSSILLQKNKDTWPMGGIYLRGTMLIDPHIWICVDQCHAFVFLELIQTSRVLSITMMNESLPSHSRNTFFLSLFSL